PWGAVGFVRVGKVAAWARVAVSGDGWCVGGSLRSPPLRAKALPILRGRAGVSLVVGKVAGVRESPRCPGGAPGGFPWPNHGRRRCARRGARARGFGTQGPLWGSQEPLWCTLQLARTLTKGAPVVRHSPPSAAPRHPRGTQEGAPVGCHLQDVQGGGPLAQPPGSHAQRSPLREPLGDSPRTPRRAPPPGRRRRSTWVPLSNPECRRGL